MSPARKNKKSHRKEKTNRNSERENNVTVDNFEGLLKKKWKVFRVSPLHNFTIGKFRFYEKKLNEEITSKKRMPATYKSTFTLIENLRLNEQCCEGVQVEIIRDDLQRIYLAQFISCSASKPVTDGSISLPILLVEGKENEIHGVHQALSKIFDCDIQPVTFSCYALITFLVKLLETQRNGIDISQEQIVMEYKIPECEAKDRIKVTLFLESATVVYAVVMDGLREKYHDVTPTEIIWEFYNKILNHIYHVYKLELILAELQKISFPDAFITADGQIKMTSSEAAASALEVLGHFTPLDSVVNISRRMLVKL